MSEPLGFAFDRVDLPEDRGEAKTFLSYEEAKRRLPNGDTIHTFRQGGSALIGADWPRERILGALLIAPFIEETGPTAQSFDHGLCIFDEHGTLFIATRPEARR